MLLNLFFLKITTASKYIHVHIHVKQELAALGPKDFIDTFKAILNEQRKEV